LTLRCDSGEQKNARGDQKADVGRET
jgi:hypothetical protein